MLTEAEIKRLIDDDEASELKKFAAVGQRYYEARHDILQNRLFYFNADGVLVEDKTRANVKIPHPFFTELADQLPAYMLSFKQNPMRAKELQPELQKYLDLYFDSEFWAEFADLIRGAYIKGFDYIYAYKNSENRLSFQYADGMGVVEVRAKDTDDGCKYVIYWYIDRIEKGKKEIRRIQVWSETETRYYVQEGRNGAVTLDTEAAVNPRPHVVYTDKKTGQKMGYALGYIPFWRLDYNRKRISGLKPVKPLIDDYDIHACSLSNNLKDFDTPLYVVSGFQGDNLEELQQNLKTKKIVGVDSEGGVEVRTVDIPFQARKEKLEIDERNIYRFGMGLNTLGLRDTAATTNLAIKAAYSLLKMKADNVEKYAKKLLKSLLKVVLAEINAEHKTDYQITDVEIIFDREPMENESETLANEKLKADTQQVQINTILNVAEVIGEEETLKAICENMGLNYDELQGQLEKVRAEQEALAAKTALDGIQPAEEVATPTGTEQAVAPSM